MPVTHPDMLECARRCGECHRLCVEALRHFLALGGAHAEPAVVRLLLDCAQICNTNQDFVLRQSPLLARTCRLCAEVCADCSQQCDLLAYGDVLIERCAAACRDCAQACQAGLNGAQPCSQNGVYVTQPSTRLPPPHVVIVRAAGGEADGRRWTRGTPMTSRILRWRRRGPWRP